LVVLPIVLTGVAFAQPIEAVFRPGLRTLEQVDDATGDPLLMRVWYPTRATEGSGEIAGVPVVAALDALPAPGRFGLIAISHGTGGSPLQHRDTAAALARAGWIAVALRHPRNHVADDSAAGSRAMWLARPRQVRQSIDAILADPELRSVADPRRIGAIGYSAGGATALMLIGASADLRNAADHCRAHGDEDAACGGGTFRTRVRAVLDVAYEMVLGRSQAWDRLRDPRVRAAVLMAPVAVHFDSASFEGVSAPVRLYRAERDEALTHPFHAERIRNGLPGELEYVVVEGAPHGAFVTPRASGATGQVAEDCEPECFDHARFHERLNEEIASFFARVLAPAED
jgi:predicted dienelactone hydrolase